MLTIAVMAASLVQAGDFTVSGRTSTRTLRSQVQATQFLARATFGFTETDIDDLAQRIRQIGQRRALTEWIDDQADPWRSPPHRCTNRCVAVAEWTTGMIRSLYPSQRRAESVELSRLCLVASGTQCSRSTPSADRAFALMQIVVINRDANIFGSIAADSSQNGQESTSRATPASSITTTC